jgi:hypothetical protein
VRKMDSAPFSNTAACTLRFISRRWPAFSGRCWSRETLVEVQAVLADQPVTNQAGAAARRSAAQRAMPHLNPPRQPAEYDHWSVRLSSVTRLDRCSQMAPRGAVSLQPFQVHQQPGQRDLDYCALLMQQAGNIFSHRQSRNVRLPPGLR